MARILQMANNVDDQHDGESSTNWWIARYAGQAQGRRKHPNRKLWTQGPALLIESFELQLRSGASPEWGGTCSWWAPRALLYRMPARVSMPALVLVGWVGLVGLAELVALMTGGAGPRVGRPRGGETFRERGKNVFAAVSFAIMMGMGVVRMRWREGDGEDEELDELDNIAQISGHC